ncbi:MAG: zinc-ribbon domain-containing protein [Eubacteriales bacterium]|nr:zinc-ribbon domain-containing protein [Eubacteriales bacterium]
MFCKYCGSEIENDAVFCAKCGKKLASVNNPDDSVKNLSQEPRNEELLSKLGSCVELLNPMQGKYDLRNDLIINLSRKTNFILLYVVFIIIGFILGNTLDYAFWEMGIQTFGVMLCWIGIGIGVPALISKSIKDTNANNYTNFKKLDAELKEAFKTLNLPIQLAYEYSDPRVIKSLISTVENGRANTLKEAINIIMDDEYKALSVNLPRNTTNNEDLKAMIALMIYVKNNGEINKGLS